MPDYRKRKQIIDIIITLNLSET